MSILAYDAATISYVTLETSSGILSAVLSSACCFVLVISNENLLHAKHAVITDRLCSNLIHLALSYTHT